MALARALTTWRLETDLEKYVRQVDHLDDGVVHGPPEDGVALGVVDAPLQQVDGHGALALEVARAHPVDLVGLEARDGRRRRQRDHRQVVGQELLQLHGRVGVAQGDRLQLAAGTQSAGTEKKRSSKFRVGIFLGHTETCSA